MESMMRKKRCSTCNEAKPATSEFFNKDATRPDGLRFQCRDCSNSYRQHKRLTGKTKERLMQTCSKCGLQKPLSRNFATYIDDDGLRHHEKTCCQCVRLSNISEKKAKVPPITNPKTRPIPATEKMNTRVEEYANEHFYSLVGAGRKPKVRVCLKCRVQFNSAHAGNRTCGTCSSKNSRSPIRASTIFKE